MLGHLLHHPPPLLFSISKPYPKLNFNFKFTVDCCINKQRYSIINSNSNSKSKSTIWSKTLISLAIAVAVIAPLPSSAIPSLSGKSFSVPSTTTPFSQAQNLPTGLENGKIRACPSINPGCVSSNPRSSSFAFPWRIVGYSSNSAAIQAEVDGGFGRDVVEFLVNGDVVSFRGMATKVTYVYPFTTALGDSKGQEGRLKQIINELGWDAPSFDDSME